MPRSARLDIPDLLQHVIVRGVDRCDLFRDDSDRIRFLQKLSKLLVQTGVKCLAWSLMTNHVHLLLLPRQSRLAPFMSRPSTSDTNRQMNNVPKGPHPSRPRNVFALIEQWYIIILANIGQTSIKGRKQRERTCSEFQPPRR